MCRHLEVAESTWHRWLAQYGGMKANDAKRLKELEAENARLKKLVANQALDIDIQRLVFCARNSINNCRLCLWRIGAGRRRWRVPDTDSSILTGQSA